MKPALVAYAAALLAAWCSPARFVEVLVFVVFVAALFGAVVWLA